MEQNKLKSAVESLLFVSGEPIKISKLVKLTGALKPEVENALMMLITAYESQGNGLRIVKKDDQVQMTTSPDNAPYVQQLVEGELQEDLSTASLEVLSIIAYRGPITRANIEAVRGVNCSYTLRNLLIRGLVERNDNPKDARGYVYGISFEFLKKLGINDIKNLPNYDEMSKDERVDNIISNQ